MKRFFWEACAMLAFIGYSIFDELGEFCWKRYIAAISRNAPRTIKVDQG